MSQYANLLVGMFIGGLIGFFTAALMAAAKRGDVDTLFLVRNELRAMCSEMNKSGFCRYTSCPDCPVNLRMCEIERIEETA